MKYAQLIICLCLLASSGISYSGSAATDTNASKTIAKFHLFWPKFRQAVIKNDKEAIAAMARFPFTTRGPYDGDPERTYNRASFLKILDELLRDGGGMRADETQKNLVKRTNKVPVRDGRAPGINTDGRRASVGNFEFKYTPKGWKFTHAYTRE